MPGSLASTLVPRATQGGLAGVRRALLFVDMHRERHSNGALNPVFLVSAGIITFFHLRYFLPIMTSWGSQRSAGHEEPNVGGPACRVTVGAPVTITVWYLFLLHFGARIMARRPPVRALVFELMIMYNLTQMLLNLFVVVGLLRAVWLLGYRWPWGNQYNYTPQDFELGRMLWLTYHFSQLELLDSFFLILRKRFLKISFLHVSLRILNMWGWFCACRYACGGDAYFPAVVNACTRVLAYAFYTCSLLTTQRIPLLHRGVVTSVQLLQFFLCAMHAVFAVVYFPDPFPRPLAVLYFLIMVTGLVLYTDFHYQRQGKSAERRASLQRVSFSFDSSGWLYCYHFGVAAWLEEHLVPEGLTPEEASGDKFPPGLAFSGSSGGALVASVLACGIGVPKVFEMVLSKHGECQRNPFRMFAAVEDVLRRALPHNACECLSGRVRVLLTRVSWKYPFFMAEAVDHFNDLADVFHTLRASCHVPMVAGIGPYSYDSHAYFDGMFWSSSIVPWKGSHDDVVVKISAFTAPTSDIKPPLMPIWWSLFPPEVEVLRGLYWQGYKDAANWFLTKPGTRNPGCCRRTRSGGGDSLPSTPREANDSAVAAARKLLLRTPAEQDLPPTDPASGRSPAELVATFRAALDRDWAGFKKALCAVVLAWAAIIVCH